MGIIKKYKVVILIVLPIIALVIIRSYNPYHFQSDAKKWAEPSVLRSNILTLNQLQALSGEKLLVNLCDNDSIKDKYKGVTLRIPPSDVLLRNNYNVIRKHKGSVLIYSSDPAISARIWMVLSQMGLKNIYIIINSDKNDNEDFKNKFRPDSLIRPELKSL